MVDGVTHPVLIAITTPGSNTAGVCYEQRTYLTRTQVDEEYFGLIYEADEADDPGDPVTWAKANLGLGRAKGIEYMQRQWTKASVSPVAMGEFLRKHLDVWTSVGASAIDLTKWRSARRRSSLPTRIPKPPISTAQSG